MDSGGFRHGLRRSRVRERQGPASGRGLLNTLAILQVKAWSWGRVADQPGLLARATRGSRQCMVMAVRDNRPMFRSKLLRRLASRLDIVASKLLAQDIMWRCDNDGSVGDGGGRVLPSSLQGQAGRAGGEWPGMMGAAGAVPAGAGGSCQVLAGSSKFWRVPVGSGGFPWVRRLQWRTWSGVRGGDGRRTQVTTDGTPAPF